MSSTQELDDCLARLEMAPDDRDAILALVPLLGVEGDTERVLEAGRDIYAAKTDWEGLRAYYDTLLDEVSEPVTASRIMYGIGQVLETHLEQPNEAIRLYQEAFRANPAEVRSLHAARAIYQLHGQHPAVGTLLELELQVVDEPLAASYLWVELGQLKRDHLDDVEGAKEAFQKALDLMPTLSVAQEELDSFDADAVVAVDGPQPPSSLPEELDEDEELLEFEDVEAVEVESTDEEELLFSDDADGEEASDIPPAPPEEDVSEEDVVETDLETGGDQPDDAQLEGASDEETVAPEETPSDNLSDSADTDEAPEVPADDGVEDSEVEDSEVEDEAAVEDEALVATEDEVTTLESESPSEDAAAAVETGARSFDDWIALAESTVGAEAAQLLMSALGALDEPRDSALVQDVFSRALEHGEDPQQLVDALRPKVLFDTDAWEGVLKSLTGALDDESEPVLRRAIFEVAFYSLGDFDRAVELAGEDVADPSNVIGLANVGNWRKTHLELAAFLNKAGSDNAEYEAIEREAKIALGLGKLEKTVESLRKLSRKVELTLPMRNLLKALYRREEKWNPLLDLLKREVDNDDDEAEKIHILREMVAIYQDRLKLDVMVVQTYNKIRKIDPSDQESLKALTIKLEEMRRFPDLVDVLRQRASISSTAEEQVGFLLQVANIYVDKFSNQAEAVRSYEQVREVEPDNVQAIEFLSKMYRQRGDWQKFVDVRRSYIAQLEDDEERLKALSEIATVAFERLQKPALSEEFWQAVLETDPNHDVALGSLAKVYERQKQWDLLAEILERRLALVEGDERKALLEKLGGILADRLSDRAKAVETYEALIELEPNHRRAADALKKSYIELMWWDRLEAFYDKSDNWTEYVRLLDTLAGTRKDPATQVDLLFRSAAVWLDRLDNTARSVRSLERVMSFDPENLEAAAKLGEFYESAGNQRKLRDVLGVLLAGEVELERRFELLLKLARLNRDLRDHATAFGLFCQALETAPTNVDILDELETATAQVDRWDDLETTCRTALEKAKSIDEVESSLLETLQLRLGALLDEKLMQIEEARVCYQSVLDDNPDNLVAIQALISIHQRQGNTDSLLDMYGRRLELTEDAELKVEILSDVAAIHEGTQGDRSSAIEKHLQVLDLVESAHQAHQTSLSSLHRLYREQEDWASLVGIIDQEIASTDEGDRNTQLMLYRERGYTCLYHLADVAGAIESYTEVLKRDPSEPKARSDLASLLDHPEFALQACDIFEPIYDKELRWDELVRVIEIRLERERAIKKTLKKRCGFLDRIVELHADKRHDIPAAFEAATRRLVLAPADTEARERLESFAAAIKAWDQLAEVYADRLLDLKETAKKKKDRELAATYAFRLAQISESKLEDLDRAIECYRETLELSPKHRDALDELAQLYTRTAMWHELHETHQRQIELTKDADEIRQIRFQLASLQQNMLGEPTQAISTYLEVLAENPEDTTSLVALDELYAGEGRFSELAENLGRQIELSDVGTDEWSQLMCRQADVFNTELGNPEHAVDSYQTVVDSRSDDVTSLSALEQLLQEPIVAGKVARILTPIYETAGETGKLVATLEVELEHSDEIPDRLTLYHRIAELTETDLSNAAGAFDVLVRAATESCLDEKTLTHLYRIAQQEQVWEQLAGHMEELASSADSMDDASALYVRLAQLSEEKLKDGPRAAGFWRDVLERNPGDSQAILALEQLYIGMSVWEPLVEVLLQKAELPELADDVEGKKAVLYQAATLYEEMLEQKDEAIGILEQIVGLDDKDPRALDMLDRLYRLTSRFTDLIDNCLRRMGLAEDAEQRREIRFEMGPVYEEELQDSDQAIEVYRQILDDFDSDARALASLERLYTDTERWLELSDNLEAQKNLATEPTQALTLRYRAGQLTEKQLDDVPKAIEVYAEVLAADPTFESAKTALQELLGQRRETKEVAKVLGPLYRNSGAWMDLIEMHRVLIEECDLEEQRAEHYETIADIYQKQLDLPAGAFEALLKALQEQPSKKEFAQRLESLARGLQRFGDVVALFSDLRDTADDPIVRVDLGKRCARIFELELTEQEQAIDAYNAVLTIDPNELESLQALDGLYESQGQWSELADIIHREIDLAEDDKTIIDLRYRLGTIYESLLDAAEQAVSTFNEILALAPKNTQAIQALEAMSERGTEPLEIAPILEPIYAEEGAWNKLIALKLALLQYQDSQDERFATLLDAGEIAFAKQEDEPAAMTIYGTALCERPSDEEIVERLEKLAESTGDYSTLASIYGSVIETEPDPLDAQRVGLKLAETLYRKLDDMEAAQGWYHYALKLDASSVDALVALDEIYTRTSSWNELAAVLRQRREQAMSDVELVELSCRLADLYKDQLGDLEAAVEAYNDVLDGDPMHRPALLALENIYQQLANWEQLYETFERQSNLAETDDERATIYVRMAELAMSQLERTEDAITHWNQVLDIKSDDDKALSSLEFLYEMTDRPTDLVEVLEKRVNLGPAPDQKRLLVAKIGRVWSNLDDPDQAITAYRQLLELEPGNIEALTALRILFDQTADSASLADVVSQIIASGTLDADGLLKAYQQTADLYGDVLGEPDKAIQAWTSFLSLKPGDDNALDQLERFYLDGNRWEEAVQVLTLKADLAPEMEDKIEFRVRIAELYQNQINDETRAAEGWNHVLQIDPTHQHASLCLEELHQKHENWDQLVETYLKRIEHTPDRLDRLQLLRNTARIFEEKTGNKEHAFWVMIRAFREDPLDTETADKLEELTQSPEQWERVTEQYGEAIGDVATSRGAEETLMLHQRLAGFYHQKLQRSVLAEVHYDKVLELDPVNEVALNELESIYETAEDWNKLIGILKRRLDLPIETESQVDLFLKIGQIQENRLGSLDEAVHAYKMALSADETSAPAMVALERIHQGRSEWRQLIEVLSQRASISYESAETVQLKFQVGQLWETHMQVPERAIDVYREILSIDPEYLPALDSLQQLYVNLEKWDRYLDVLELRLNLQQPEESKVAILNEMARIYQTVFKEFDRAVDCYRQVLETQPGNTDAIRSLVTVYSQSEYWDDLAAMLAEQNEKVTDEVTRAEFLALEGQVAREQLGDMFRAITCFQRVLEVWDDNYNALNALALLYEEVGQWEQCIDAYNKLLMGAPDMEARTSLLCRVGRIYEQNIADDESALERFQTALDLDPGCGDALDSLRRLHEKREDWPAAVQILKRQVEYGQDLAAKSTLLAQIGAIYEQRIQDKVGGVEYYEEAIALHPHNVLAAAPLADYYLAEKHWARAMPLLETLIASEAYADQGEQLGLLHYNLAVVAEELGQEEKAQIHFRESYELNRRHLPTLEGLGRLYLKRGEHDRGMIILDEMLKHHGHELGPDAVAEIYARQGEIKLQLGEKRAAQDLFEKALAKHPADKSSLRQMIELMTERADWTSVVDYQTRLAETTDDTVEQFKLVVDTGDIFRDRLGQMESAIETYKMALELDPNSKVVLQRLLNIFTQAEQWKRASEILGKLAELETDPERHAKICLTIAYVLKDHLDDAEKAVQFFNRTLDAQLTYLEAFQQVDGILTEQKAWKELEQNYRKMIKRVTEHDEGQFEGLKVMLWENLGEIYRTRLQSFDEAIAAYKIAARLDPSNTKVHEILADLFERVGGHQEDAIAEHHSLIKASPNRVESYQALFNRYLEHRDFDAAWCVASALVMLGEGGSVADYYNRYLGSKPPMTKKQLTPEQWELLYHDEQDLALGNVMALFASYLRSAISYDLKSTWKVHKKKDLVDLSQPMMFSNTFNYAVRVLGVQPPLAYLQRDQIGGIRNANSDPPALVVGADIVQGRPGRELAFAIGKALCLVRPEHYLGSAYPVTDNLKLFFFAALTLTPDPNIPKPPLTPDMANIIKEAQKNPHLIVAIQKATRKYLDLDKNPNYSLWLKTLDYTSDRVGLVLCGDLQQAINTIKTEQLAMSKASATDRVRELVLFGVSRQYLQLRKELEIAIGSQQ